MKVIEIFESIQGEGVQMGKAVTFLRLAGCNLHCPWCDTKESWGDVGTEMDIELVCNRIRELGNHIVVITGGEPTTCKELKTITNILHFKYDMYVCIETNGTNELTHDDGIDWITCSPKPESDYAVKCDADEIKLVITEDFDTVVIDNILAKFDRFIWLQPNGYDMQNMWKKCHDIVMSYGKDNVRVGVQLHKLMEVK